MTRTSAARNWILAAVLIGTAWAATTAIPDDIHEVDPFVTTVPLGEAASIGDRSITVTGVTMSDGIRAESSETSLPGTWLVFAAEADIGVSEADALIGWATLEIGERTFVPSDRWNAQFTSQRLLIDIPTSGSFVFEIPPELRAEDAVLRLGNTIRSQHLGEVVEIPIDLDELSLEHDFSVPRTRMTGL